MRPVRPLSETVDGVKAESLLRALAGKYGLSINAAAERIQMSKSTIWRWRHEELRPMPWQVNLMTMSILEMAERAGTINDEDLATLNGFRTKPPAPRKKVTLSQVKRLRAQLAEAERLLMGKQE